jgi:hypothetical protein
VNETNPSINKDNILDTLQTKEDLSQYWINLKGSQRDKTRWWNLKAHKRYAIILNLLVMVHVAVTDQLLEHSADKFSHLKSIPIRQTFVFLYVCMLTGMHQMPNVPN